MGDAQPHMVRLVGRCRMCRCALYAFCGVFKGTKKRDEDRARECTFRSVAFLCAVLLLFVWWAVQESTGPEFWEKFKPFIEKVLEAGFVAAVLALTIDMFLKKQIARDAFEASIGYILPTYLQEEIRAIYSNEVICVDHAQNVVISPLGASLVRAEVRTYRKLENIGTNSHHLDLALHVDEWFEDSASTIGDCGYRVDGGEAVQFEERSKINTPVPKLVAEAKNGVDLKPGSVIEVWHMYGEIKRRSDLQYLAFDYATNRPRVHVSVPDGFDFSVEFTHRLATEKVATDDTTLPGLLLPNQCIIVRWWEKEKLEQWKGTSTS